MVASTLNLNDSDIQNGKFTLTGNPKSTARVENHGSIQTLSGGTVALIAPNVKNTGRISSPNGTTHLTAASQVTLALQDGSLTQYQVDQGVFKGLVDNGGAIIADNGAVYLTAKAKDRLSKAVVNHSGIIEANRLSQNAKGEIILLGDMQNGETTVSGVLKAEGRNGQDGGFIETSAAKVKIENSTVVSTRSQGGKTGNWLIDPIDFNINAGNAAQDSSGMGATTLANNLANNNVTVETSTGGSQKGDINVNAEVKWDSANSLTLNAHNDININANITATHNKGKLNLIYGQDTANRDANYKLNKGAKINLRAGDNFSTKKGTEATVEYKVITALGKQDSTTGTDLQGINGNLNGNYVLGADVDATETKDWNAGEGFNPIGDRNNPFNGKLDGLGHTVSRLSINRPAQDVIGLIGFAFQAQIRNIGLLEVNIRGRNSVGALVGWNVDSRIQNAYSTGSVSGGVEVGGLVGNNSGSINNAYSTASVSGRERVGGLAGINGGSIDNAYATGAVSGNRAVGGLVGNNQGNLGQVYATGQVTGATQTGGLIGYHASGTVENAYWNIETTGQKDSWNGGNGVGCNTTNYCGLTTAEMFQKNNMKGFDFKAVWGNANNQTTPYLLGLNNNQVFNKNDLPVGPITATNRPALYTAIQNIQQLQNMQSNLAGNYAVVNHIDATETKDWNGGQGFNPIGDENNSFKGKLDGLGHTVSKLYINRPAQDDIGLIGYAQQAQIRNIGLLEANIRGRDFVGALVGVNNNGSINNAYSTGSVLGRDYVGGLVALNNDNIQNAYSTASVSGQDYVGGLVGDNRAGSIRNAYATGAVSGKNSVGGLVGTNLGSINNAYATGAVSGNDSVGGLVGRNGGNLGQVYATGQVTGTTQTGGLIGYSGDGSINNAYWNTETTGQKDSWNGGNGVDCNTNNYCGLTTAEMFQKNNMKGFDFNTVWGNAKDQTTPYLLGLNDNQVFNKNDLPVGPITATNRPALYTAIQNIQQLQNMQSNLAGNYALVNHIDATETKDWNDGQGFNPIGDGNNPFNGKLDGLGHTVSKLSIDRSRDYIGLIGYTQQAQIRNIGLLEANIRGRQFVGGLVGYNGDSSSIHNAYSTGSVSSNTLSVGGLVGINNGSINNAYSTASVSGQVFVGGLVGNNGGSIRNAYATGSVSGNSSVGGLVGENGGSIHNAYATGNVSGNDWVGGLVGQNGGSIRNAYATGAVSGGINVGGLVGRNLGSINNAYATGHVLGIVVGGLVGENSGSVNNAYWNTETTGRNSSDGGDCNTNNYCGLTTAEMFQKNNMKGFDFKAVWGNANNQTTPYLLGLNDNQVFNKNDLPVGPITATNRPALYTAIQNIQQLQNMQSNLAGNYAVVNHIDATESKDWNDGQGFNPIGDANNPFNGKLDGLGHTVSRLSINRPTQNNIGLIGSAQQAQIRNIGLLDANIRGRNNVGGLVGRSTNNSSIRNAYSTGNVSGSDLVGGLVGWNFGSIRNAYSTGAVSGKNSVGGLVGWNDGSINNAYSSGPVSGQDRVGGLVGGNGSSIRNVYATGQVTGTTRTGGLIGFNTAGTVENAYWDTESTGQKTSAGGGTGLTSAQMKDGQSFAFIDDDSYLGGKDTIWRMYQGDTAPLLRSFLTQLDLNTQNATTTYNGKNQSLADVTGLDPNKIFGGKSGGYRNAGSHQDRYYSNQQGYDLIGVKNTASDAVLTINKATLNLNAVTDTRSYDGTNQSSAMVDISGLQTDDRVTAKQEFDSKNAGERTLNIAEVIINDGNHGGNYNIVTNTAKGVINKAKATVTANSLNTVYNGKDQTVSGFTASGLVNGETESVLTDVSAKATGKDAGKYANKAEGIDKNYELTFIDGALDIAKAKATITANSLNTVYNGKDQTVSGFTASGLVNGETESVLSDVSAKVTGKDAGKYVNKADGIDKNYELTFVDGALDIAKAKATVTANSLNTVYNGKDQTVSGFTAKGLVNGETESVLTDVSAKATGKDAGNYVNKADGIDKNYDLSFVDGSLDIAKAKATITANSLNTVYNGKEQTVAGFTASGLVNGETESVLSDVKASVSAKDAGKYANKANGVDKNYELTFVDGALDIAKAKATITANSLNTVYNGKDQTVSGFTASDLVNGETESVLSDVKASVSAKDAGKYVNKADGIDKNYDLSFVDGSLDIAKAKATVTANSLNTVYNGKEQTVAGFTASGLVNGETESVLSDVKASVSAKDAGKYVNKADGIDKNYELTFIDGALDIAKAKATITANSLNTVYNGKEQTVSGFTAKGLVNGETESVLSDVKASVSAKDAGKYANKANGADKNYELTFVDGALDIAKAKATVTANSLNTVYNGKDQTVSGFTAKGLVNGETESVLTDVSAKVTGKDAGKYVNKAEGIDKNYELSFVDGSLDIAKAKATVTANSLNTVYNGKEQTVSGFTAKGLVNGETESVLSDVKASVSAKDAGKYANKANGADKNYELTFVDGALDIDKAKINQVKGITANNRVYDGTTNASLNTDLAQFEGLLTGDELAVASATGKFNDKNVGVGKPVSIQDIRLTGADARNYQLVDNTAMTTADIYTLTPLAYLQAKQFKPPRYLPETHNGFNTVDLEVEQGGVNIAGIQTLAGEH